MTSIDPAAIRAHLDMLYGAADPDHWFTILELDEITTDAGGTRRGWCPRCQTATDRAPRPPRREGGKPRECCTACQTVLYPERATFYRAADRGRATAFAARAAEHTNVYISMALVTTEAMHVISARHGRIKTDEAAAIVGAYGDVDVRTGRHAEQALPPDVPAALAAIAAVPDLSPPTMVVLSGGGAHAYWLTAEPYALASEDERTRVKVINRAVQAAIRKQFAAAGWALDSTNDLARVLRLGGTLNHKTTPARPVTILRADGPHATMDALEDLVSWEDMEAELSRPPAEPIAEGEQLSAGEMAEIVDVLLGAWLPGQRHPLGHAVTGWLANSGVPEADTRRVLLAVAERAGRGDNLPKIEDQVKRTYAKGRAGKALAGWKLLTCEPGRLLPKEATDRLDALMRARQPRLVFPDQQPEDMSASEPGPMVELLRRRIATLEARCADLEAENADLKATIRMTRAVDANPNLGSEKNILKALAFETASKPDDRIDAETGEIIDLRDESGAVRIYLGFGSEDETGRATAGLAAVAGVSAHTASRALKKLDAAGVIRLDPRKVRGPEGIRTETWVSFPTVSATDGRPVKVHELLATAVDARRVVTATVKGLPGGDMRGRTCAKCGSEHVKIVCLDCGHEEIVTEQVAQSRTEPPRDGDGILGEQVAQSHPDPVIELVERRRRLASIEPVPRHYAEPPPPPAMCCECGALATHRSGDRQLRCRAHAMFALGGLMRPLDLGGALATGGD